MEWITVIGAIVVVALLGVLLRGQRPEQATLLVLAAGVGVLVLLLAKAGDVFSTLYGMLEQSGLPTAYIEVLFKALGICLVTQLAADTCRDAGESAMAAKAELVGRFALLTVGLPLFQAITETALSLIG